MYLGFDSSQRGKQLRHLETLIFGYKAATDELGADDPAVTAYDGFPQYLRDRFGWSMSCGPVSAIRDATSSDDEAWERFWLLLDEYRAFADGG